MKTTEQLKSLMGKARDMKTRVDALETKRESEQTEIAKSLSQGAKGMGHPVVGASSDEKRAMAAYGCRTVKQLLEVNTGDPKFARVNERNPEFKHLVMELKKSVDTARMIAQTFYGAPSDDLRSENPRLGLVKNILETPYGRDETAARIKSFSSTTSGDGAEFVPRLLSSSYIEEYELDHVVEERFRSIPMESATYDLPVIDSVTKARKIGEKATILDANFKTDKIVFSAQKLGEFYCIPEELSEDSAPDILGAAREELVRAHARAMEDSIINGATGGHIDSDTALGDADLAVKFFDGLRKRALDNAAPAATTDFSGSAVTEALLRTMRSRMGKFGSLPSDLLWIAGPVVYVQMQGLDGVATLDKYGPMATVLRGALSAYQGIPIVNSEHMREDLAANGQHDGLTTDKAGLLLVNLRRFYVGLRRPIQVKIMPDLPYNDQMLMAAYQRKDFQGHAQSADEISVSYGINIQV